MELKEGFRAKCSGLRGVGCERLSAYAVTTIRGGPWWMCKVHAIWMKETFPTVVTIRKIIRWS